MTDRNPRFLDPDNNISADHADDAHSSANLKSEIFKVHFDLRIPADFFDRVFFSDISQS